MSIRFGSSATIPCSRNLNLLAHAQLDELELGSRCGGFGECGGDRVRVLKGAEWLSPLTEAEREHLSDEEQASGFRLACQCFPNSEDAEIELEIEAWD